MVLILITGLALAAPAAADQVVYFINGKAITVKSVEKGERLTILEIDGGGRIGVPTAQIDRIEELKLSPPPSSVAAAPQMVPAPSQNMGGTAPAQTTAVAPSSVDARTGATPPQTSVATGPGFNGQASQAPGGPGGIVPLQISGTPAQPGTAPPSAEAPPTSAASAADAKLRPAMQPGAGRQMAPRRDGAIGQPTGGLRRPGARNGAFRGGPRVAYRPNVGGAERPQQDRAPAADPNSAPQPPQASDNEPPVDPAVAQPPPESDGEAAAPREEIEDDQAKDQPPDADPDAKETTEDEDADDPSEER